ncbi:MAG: SDR family NAD(P)-dependent oxidoreductase [Actinomycetota bacterium]|nr:SDR family NAD(P)-dependent oxidoreductase [Actinomycetota bacterium]
MNVSGRTVLLTGASGGIGHAIARTLHGAGARLILTGRRTDVLEALAAETGGRAVPMDLTDRGAVARLAADHADADVLVANAALPASGALLGFDVEQIDRALDVNLRAPIVLARTLGERMAARGAGHIVFVTSLSGKVGAPGSSVYSATKFGLRGFAQGLREDLRPRGVGVGTVTPGFIRDAGMLHESGAKLPPGVGTSTPEEVAAAVLRNIERDPGEIVVAPRALRAGAALSSLLPNVSATVSRRLGARKVADAISSGQTQQR